MWPILSVVLLVLGTVGAQYAPAPLPVSAPYPAPPAPAPLPASAPYPAPAPAPYPAPAPAPYPAPAPAPYPALPPAPAPYAPAPPVARSFDPTSRAQELKCPYLDPTRAHILSPSSTCKQHDQDCACVYVVATRAPDGCAESYESHCRNVGPRPPRPPTQPFGYPSGPFCAKNVDPPRQRPECHWQPTYDNRGCVRDFTCQLSTPQQVPAPQPAPYVPQPQPDQAAPFPSPASYQSPSPAAPSPRFFPHPSPSPVAPFNSPLPQSSYQPPSPAAPSPRFFPHPSPSPVAPLPLPQSAPSPRVAPRPPLSPVDPLQPQGSFVPPSLQDLGKKGFERQWKEVDRLNSDEIDREIDSIINGIQNSL